LDERLRGRGWPRTGLIEILVSRFGIGELYLLLPALAALSRRPSARWCLWVAPPMDLFAPALEAQGLALDRVLVVRAGRSLMRARRSLRYASSEARSSSEARPSREVPSSMWTFEQSLGSGACDAVMAWSRHPRAKELRRL